MARLAILPAWPSDELPASTGTECTPQVFRFGAFELDEALFQLRSGGVPQPVQPRVFDLMLYLIKNRDRVVTHEELFSQLWSGLRVTASSLTFAVRAARLALGDSGSSQRFISNVRSRGYRFVGSISVPGEACQGEEADVYSLDSRRKSSKRSA